MVVADGTANPSWIALDLCAQAEHGEDSPLIVASPDLALLDRVAELVAELVAAAPERRRGSARPGRHPRARGGADARRRGRPRAPRARLRGSRRERRPGADRRLRVRRGGRCDGVRRLRGRLEPRASDRRRGTLRRPAWAGSVPSPDLGGHAARRLPRERSPPTWAPWRAPRAFPCTASRPRPEAAPDPQRCYAGLQVI